MTASDRRNILAVLGTGALLFSAALSLGRAGEKAAPPPPSAPQAAWGANGRIEPAGEERQLRFPTAGRIARVAVEEGQTVKAGDVLAELENSEEKAALAQAEADAARAQAELDKLENGARAEEKAVADAEVLLSKRELDRVEKGARTEEKDLAAAHAAVRKAEAAAAGRVADRVRKLREGETKAASQEELDAAEDRLAVARAAEAEAKSNWGLVAAPAREEDLEISRARAKLAEEHAALVKAKARAEDLAAGRAALAAAKAGQAAAAARLEKTLLKSPIDGTVLKVFQRAGEAASPISETAVAAVGDVSKLMVRAEIDEVDVLRVRQGQVVRADATGLGELRMTGKVVRVGLTMGRKRLISNDPREKVDTKVLEALVELDGKPNLPVGYRVTVKCEGER